MPKDAHPLPPNYQRNFAAYILDYSAFMIGLGFINMATILPALTSQLTNSAPLIGLSSSVFTAGWPLPQLVTAHLTKDKPLKKPILVAGLPLRLVLPIIAVALWAGLARYPTAMLTLLFVNVFLFAVTDGFMSIVWFDIMARAIPAHRRGRLIGLGQLIGGLGGIGVGALVGLILERWSFPQSYASLFACASAGILVSSFGTLAIREPAPELPARSETAQKGPWLRLLARDKDFRRLMASRILVGMTTLATPFYVVHAADVLHLPESTIGGFVIANTVGGLTSSVLLGILAESRGPRFTIRLSSAIAAAGPLLVLCIELGSWAWLRWAYPLAFAALGVGTSAMMLGFLNYTLEIAPASIRPAYVGLANTVVAPMALVPAVGGWLLQATSYPVLFASAATLSVAGFVFTLSLRSPHVIASEWRAL